MPEQQPTSRKDAKMQREVIAVVENPVATDIVDAAVHIHSALGPGLLESVYERVLAYELLKRAHQIETQAPIPVVYDGHRIEEAFRADMLVDDCVLVELKSIENLAPIHKSSC